MKNARKVENGTWDSCEAELTLFRGGTCPGILGGTTGILKGASLYFSLSGLKETCLYQRIFVCLFPE